MIEKVENAYLAILRAVVIAASGIMLIAALLFGASAMTGFWGGVDERIAVPDVDQDEVLAAVTAPPAEDVPRRESSPQDGRATPVDPNQKHYEAAAAAIVSFVTRLSGNNRPLSERAIADVIKQRAESFDEDHLTQAYARGFARAIDGMLKDRRIQERATNSTPVEVVNELLNAYTQAFREQVTAEEERIAKEQDKAMERQAAAIRFLTAAGVCFGIFLAIVFLSIFIKIEVNLRNLATAVSQGRSG